MIVFVTVIRVRYEHEPATGEEGRGAMPCPFFLDHRCRIKKNAPDCFPPFGFWI